MSEQWEYASYTVRFSPAEPGNASFWVTDFDTGKSDSMGDILNKIASQGWEIFSVVATGMDSITYSSDRFSDMKFSVKNYRLFARRHASDA